MAYPFMTAGALINNKTPKQNYIDLTQQTLNDEFYDSSDWFTIQEETAFASGEYQNIDVRVNSVVNPTTGDNIEDDFKKLLFPDLTHPVELGKFYKFDDNYWMTINVDKIKTLYQTILVRRCNNSLRWIDEKTGALYTQPCVIEYRIKENRDYSTAGSAIVVPSGMIEVYYQVNDQTNKIKPNQRFLFGNPSNWTSYRVEGGGISNFNLQKTLDNTTAGFGRLSMTVDFKNYEDDDLTNGIANNGTNIYVLTLNQSSISGDTSQTVQLVATLTLNGFSASKTLVWSSSDETIATVSPTGLVTFVGEGTATITCELDDNATVKDTCSVTVGTSPVDNYQVVISPSNKNYILEGLEQTWTVYLYKNGVQQSDAFVFTLDPNTVPNDNYIYTLLGDNSFKVKNVQRFLTDYLEVSCVSGSYSEIIQINLRGAW